MEKYDDVNKNIILGKNPERLTLKLEIMEPERELEQIHQVDKHLNIAKGVLSRV